MPNPPTFQFAFILALMIACPFVVENVIANFQEPTASDVDKSNPYAVPSHWSPQDITDHLLAAADKPRSIRRRDPFVQGICAAADRVLAAPSSTAIQRRIAAIEKSRTLHFHASWGNESSDRQLIEFLSTLDELAQALDSDPLRREAAFVRLERQLIDFESKDPAQIRSVLTDVHEYLVTQPLTDRHLRVASNVVRVINLLDSADPNRKRELDQQRELMFAKFGKLFQQSREIRLARYGRNLANTQADAKSLVGTRVSIEGVTLLDGRISVEGQQGKIVLVDFWATWCAPCRKSLPIVKAIDEQFGPDEFAIVGVSLDKDLEDLREYVAENQITWPNIIDTDAERIANEYSVVSIPTFFVLDGDRRVLIVSNRISDVKPVLESAIQQRRQAQK